MDMSDYGFVKIGEYTYKRALNGKHYTARFLVYENIFDTVTGYPTMTMMLNGVPLCCVTYDDDQEWSTMWLRFARGDYDLLEDLHAAMMVIIGEWGPMMIDIVKRYRNVRGMAEIIYDDTGNINPELIPKQTDKELQKLLGADYPQLPIGQNEALFNFQGVLYQMLYKSRPHVGWEPPVA